MAAAIDCGKNCMRQNEEGEERHGDRIVSRPKLLVNRLESQSTVSLESQSTVSSQDSAASAGSALLRRRRLQDARCARPISITTERQSDKPCDPAAQQFDVVKVLGAGSVGCVRHAVRKADGKHVALKTVSRPDKRSMAQAEYELLKRLNHPNIVRTLDLLVAPHYTTIVMDLVVGSNLAEAVRAVPDRRFSEGTARGLGKGILKAVDYLHKNRIVHRDIKPENVLVTSCLTHAKLADFGAACNLAASVPLTPTGTKLYAAPEVLLDDFAPSERSDVWSLGVCIYFMLSGRLPQGRGETPPSTELMRAAVGNPVKLDDHEAMRAAVGSPVKLDDHEVWAEISPPCKEVLRHCLALEWTERLAPMVLLRCDWFQHAPANTAAKSGPAGVPPTRGLTDTLVIDDHTLLEIRRIACMSGKSTTLVKNLDAISDICGDFSRQCSADTETSAGVSSEEASCFSRQASSPVPWSRAVSG